MSEDYGHLHPEARRYARLDDAARIERIGTDCWIEHASAAKALVQLQEAFDKPRGDRMVNVLVWGESGMGKTALARRFERRHKLPYDAEVGVARLPVLFVPTPPAPTEDGLLREILVALGAPAPPPGRPPSRELVRRLLREVGVRVVILDEINSVLGGTAREQRLFLQLLRYLSNTTPVALACTGVPEARFALRADPELKQRFREAALEGWEAGEELQRFVNHLVQSLPLRRPSPVDGPAIPRLLASRTCGITGDICAVVQRAAIAAVRSGREMIDLAALQAEEVWLGIVPPTARPGRRAGRRAA